MEDRLKNQPRILLINDMAGYGQSGLVGNDSSFFSYEI